VKRRRFVVGVVVLLAGAGTWWWSSSSGTEAQLPPVSVAVPAPVAPVAVAVATEEPPEKTPEERTPPKVAPLTDAGEPDAGEDDASPHAVKSTTYYLLEGNKLPISAISNHPFQIACRREGNACATHELFWEGPPVMVGFDLERTAESGERLKVIGRSKRSLSSSPRFDGCLERAMKAITLEDVGTGSTTRMCSFPDLREAINDPKSITEDVGKCLGPVTQAKSVKLNWVLVVNGAQVEVQNLKITSDGELDGYARRCIERAASAPPLRFGPDNGPPFTRRNCELIVVTFNEGGVSNRVDPGAGKIPSLPVIPEAPLTPSQEAEGLALMKLITVARKANRYEQWLELSARCVNAVPRFAPCWAALGSAAASVSSRDASDAYRTLAELAYGRYLEVAAPDDPNVAKVKLILGIDAGP
jgi:hypothetical protein